MLAKSDVTKAYLRLNRNLQISQKDCAKIITHSKHELTQVEVLMNICRDTGFPTSQVLDQFFPHTRKNGFSSDLSTLDFTFRTNQNKAQSSTSARNCCVTTNGDRLATPCCYTQLLSSFGKLIHLKLCTNTLIYGFLL